MLLGTFLGGISKPRTITTPLPAPGGRGADDDDDDGRTWQARSPGPVHLGDVVRSAAGATLTLTLFSWISPPKHLLS